MPFASEYISNFVQYDHATMSFWCLRPFLLTELWCRRLDRSGLSYLTFSPDPGDNPEEGISGLCVVVLFPYFPHLLFRSRFQYLF